jgi:hypothetical protein
MSHYKIIVENYIDKKRLRQFNGMEAENLPNGWTLLSGNLKDQAELFSIINKIRDMNLQLIQITNSDKEY